ncbi:hypothetical protein [Afipia sp. GAS231]|uniref:hypothetical protein n=1 Tax=Afipia sp. GAS231 TaxID=1882747 RepID=UPI0008793A53|nr:hypothetical protein [Afipia sp. GAS231]SDP05124.1 hypothetical protein SAMN05444050_5706 [Afipia sp. GAS231]
MANDHLLQLPPIVQPDNNSRKSGIWTTILLLGSIAAATVLGAGTRIDVGFEQFAKSANERVSEAFEDIRGKPSVSDELKYALLSLSQSVQGAQKPPVQAEGNE